MRKDLEDLRVKLGKEFAEREAKSGLASVHAYYFGFYKGFEAAVDIMEPVQGRDHFCFPERPEGEE